MDRVRYGYQIAMAHEPEPAKGWILVNGLDDYQEHYDARPDDATALVSMGDSSPNETINTTELAAYTALASVILNLDEFITRE